MENEKQKAVVVITYNSVDGYPSGTYEGGNTPVIVHSNANLRTWGAGNAEGKLGEVLHGIYGRIDPEDVKKVYLYIGLHAKNGALQAARNIAGEGNKLELVACGCDSGEKQRVADEIGAPIIWSRCGGREVLGRIVHRELNG